MNINDILNVLLGWPIMIWVVGVGIVCTVAFRGIQIRSFFRAWRYALAPQESHKSGDMTPLQAFIGTLNSNLGNGSIAGMATAIYSGGPGAALWVVIIGVILMSVRFAEVYLGVAFSSRATQQALGGPMVYLRAVPAGTVLAYCYGIACLLFCLLGGNAVQSNSMSISLTDSFGIPSLVTACVMLGFIFYVVQGGAARIMKAAEKIIPLKVGLFFISSTIVLAYHYQSLWSSLQLIVMSACCPQAVAGGVVGFSITQAMRYGMFRSIMSTESGVGTAAVFYGATGGNNPVKNGIVSMLSTFISTVVCFLVSLCIIASGVWNSGLTSTALTGAAYKTVFGIYGGWIVTFLSLSFGIGVMVVFAYLSRQAWFFLTGGRYLTVFNIVYAALAFIGALVSVTPLWALLDVVNAMMLIINLFGIVYLIPTIVKGLAEHHD